MVTPIAKIPGGVALALAVAACGGGGGGAPAAVAPLVPAPPASTAPPPPPEVGALTAVVVDVDGKPIAGATACISIGIPQCRDTDSSGTASITNFPVGDASVSASHPDYIGTDTSTTITVGRTANVRLALTPGNRHAVVMARTRGQLANDLKTVDIELDVAVVDSNGAAIQSLTAADFSPLSFYCEFWHCGGGIIDAIGPYDLVPGLTLQPAAARRTYAALIVLDTGVVGGGEVAAAHEIAPGLARVLASATAADRVTIAAPRKDGDGCTLQRVGMVSSSDGTGTKQLPAGSLDGCATTMKDLLAAAIPLAFADPGFATASRRSVVLISPRGNDADAADAATADANARGLELWILSSGGGAAAAARTNGAYASYRASRAQLAPILAALDGLLAGSTASFRLTTRYSAGGELFVSGTTLHPAIDVRMPSGTILGLQEFAVLLPPAT